MLKTITAIRKTVYAKSAGLRNAATGALTGVGPISTASQTNTPGVATHKPFSRWRLHIYSISAYSSSLGLAGGTHERHSEHDDGQQRRHAYQLDQAGALDML